MRRINDIISYIQMIEISNIIDLIIAISVVIMFLILSPIISYIILKIFYRQEDKSEIHKSPIYKTVRTYLNFLGIYIATKILGLSNSQDAFFDMCFRIINIWTIVNVVAGIMELNIILINKMDQKNKIDISKNDKFTFIIINKLIKYVLYILAAYLTVKELGYDVAGLATGIGIGGAIVVLAAQNLVKQILAGFAIVSDKPFVIGDYIEVVKGSNSTTGNVVSINWRSTKLKTSKDTIVTIDNNEIITANLINWGKINKRVYTSDLHLALETDEQVVEKVINRIKFILKNDTKINEETMRVNLTSIDGDSLTISIYIETDITDYSKYSEFCTKLNLTILNILESQGISLAYPGRNVYIKNSERSLPKEKTVKHIVKENDKKTSKPVKIRN